ncbi:MAG: zinc ribbon domain-containing protein [Thermoplasmata archaeon]
MVSTATLDTEIGIVIVGIFAVLVGVYALYRYLRRRGPELAAREGRNVLDDRSYNQIRIGQAAADRLAQTGVDVSAAKELLRRAEAARVGRNYDMSIDLAKKAADALAAARAGGNPGLGSGAARPTSSASVASSPSPAPAMRPGAFPAYTAPPTVPFIAADADSMPEPGSAPEPVSNRPPKNKMEAHFQLSVVQDELDQARATKSRTKGFRDAERLRNEGQAAYDKQDFTEALRLGLKSRRTLGMRVEALPVSTVPASSPSPGDTEAAAAAAARASGSLFDEPTFGQKCPKCGRIAAATDQFCRGCGSPIAPALCNNCGAPLLAGDRFCAKCGATQN